MKGMQGAARHLRAVWQRAVWRLPQSALHPDNTPMRSLATHDTPLAIPPLHAGAKTHTFARPRPFTGFGFWLGDVGCVGRGPRVNLRGWPLLKARRS